jgi:hypothetical protein
MPQQALGAHRINQQRHAGFDHCGVVFVGDFVKPKALKSLSNRRLNKITQFQLVIAFLDNQISDFGRGAVGKD